VKPIRLALPWLAGALILALLFARVDLAVTREAIADADLLVYVPVALAFTGVWLALDAFVLRGLFASVGAELSLVGMMQARAATYPWMAVSFDLANVALVNELRRATGAPLAQLAGAMLAHYGCDLVALSTIAAAASLALEGSFSSVLRPILLGLAGLALAVLVAARLGVARIGRGAFADALRSLRARDLARVVALRWLFYASFAVFVWATLPCFALRVPFLDVLARMPLVQSIAALPISPSGIGTAQAAMLALFTGFGPPARWLAYSLVYGLTLVLLRLPIGFAAWGRRLALAA
jgi:Lysylphosphatidylglycerol synthase TM region